MLLTIDEEQAQLLIDSCALVPQDSNHFGVVVSIPGASGHSVIIPVEIKYEKQPEKIVKSAMFKKADLKDYYEQFKNIFPTSDAHGNFPRRRSLRGDSKRQGEKRFIELVQVYGFDPKDIINACIYEVDWRQKSSYKTNENVMSYMKSMVVWLNDEEHVRTQIQEMKETGEQISDDNISVFDDI